LIPPAYLTAWRREAPWPDDAQIEQDLILSRLMVEIANDDLLGPELAFRGGTCLHKLHFGEPARYSEDLDYVRRTKSGVKPILTALRAIAVSVGLEEHSTERSGQMVHAKFETEPTSGGGRIRVKVEINIAETESLRPRICIPFEVDSRWWAGSAEIITFDLEELLGTKLRALYQRRKGRDLFDLWYALAHVDLDPEAVVAAYKHYIGDQEFTFPELAANLDGKLEDRDFQDDLLQLLVSPPAEYGVGPAADLVMNRLGALLRNAPSPEELDAAGWRPSSG
jgi:predicted nucleotidyltransferase component of viral defense system